jgi:YD repeat-containing protein
LLSTQDNTLAGGTTDDFTYAYDADNEVTSFASTRAGTMTYEYDQIGEVTTVTYSAGYVGSPGSTATYTYLCVEQPPRMNFWRGGACYGLAV